MTTPILLIALVASVFVVGVVGVDPNPRHVRTATMLALIQIILTGVGVSLHEGSFAYLFTIGLVLATMTVLIVHCTYCVLRYVLQANRITRDQINAGICVYLMLGFAFGCIYYLLNILDPDGFAVNNPALAGARSPDLMYFSFVTLATLGYGDITPATKAARALAQLEAVAGMLYIAVFMARLVSLHSTEGSSSTAAPDKQPDVPAHQSNGRDRD